jgi:hypothetical protein
MIAYALKFICLFFASTHYQIKYNKHNILKLISGAVNFRFPFPKAGSFHIFGLKAIRFILLITKNDNLYKKCIFFKTSHFPEVESFNLK